MEKIKFDCKSNNAPTYSCNKPGDNSGHYYQSTDVDELLRELLELPQVKSQLDHLDMGIGTKTAEGVWLRIRDAIA